MKEIDLVRQINNFYNKNGMICANEIRMGIGIPDILICKKDIDDIVIITDYYELDLYYFLIKTRIRRIESIKNRYIYSKEHITKYINKLEKQNIIEVYEDKVYIKNRIDKKVLGNIIAIEAKLKDWKNALIQAERYLSFSEYSYVALPKCEVSKVDRKEFYKVGIGLLGVDDKGVFEVIKPKRSSKCDMILKYIALSYINISKNLYEL